ncbi:hypothetical protein C8R47DRAFT_1328374 [Mycena vitilis]|nr:hypothetical protein C8R47DRAFT_1328374 [Mycena vitilis]
MADLPQELINAIVDEVDDENDLPSCSLAARAFVDPSQRRMFRGLSLRWDLGWDSLDRALAWIILFGNPVSAILIWEPGFSTRVPRNPVTAEAYADPAETAARRHVDIFMEVTLDVPMDAKNQGTLEAILRMLGNIEHLVIEGRGVIWQQLSPALALAIHNLSIIPSLQRLHVFRIGDIPSSLVLQAASSVRVLSLYSVDVRSGQRPSDIGPLRLQSLSLPFWPSAPLLLRCCQSLLAARTLRRLAVYVDVQRHYRILTAASSSHLRHLELECRAFLTPLDLPHLPSLRTLALSFTVTVLNNGPRVWILPDLLGPTITSLPAVAPDLDTLILTVLISREKCLPWQDHSPLPFFNEYSRTNYTHHLPQLRQIYCVLGYADPFSLLGAHFAQAYGGFPWYMESKLRAAQAAGIVTTILLVSTFCDVLLSAGLISGILLRSPFIELECIIATVPWRADPVTVAAKTEMRLHIAHPMEI